MTGRRRRHATRFLPLVVLVVLALVVTGCTGGEEPPSPTPPVQTTEKPTRLSFGVYGHQDEVTALEGVADSYNSLATGSDVEVRSWPDHEGLREAIEKGDDVPDVFMVSRADLTWLQEQGLNQPVEELLDERGVDFGDDFARDALQAFSADNRLQCMPYGISPMVIYYNEELVDFARMRERGLDAPDPEDEDPRWTFEQFAAAAAFGTRPGKRTRGLYVEPTLRGLAPFIYSGGGTLFDNDEAPTSLAFSDGDTAAALERTLELLRDPHLNLTENQLAKASPLQWFKRGRVGMIEGFRSLVPELRQVQGLEFDVMPMPVLDSSATVGDITGLCLSADAESLPAAADFLVHALSTESVARVARTGYLAPANLEVALADDFLQPGRQPEHARVFSSSVRSMEIPPPLESWSELQNAVAGSLDELVSVAVLDDLDALLTRIDEESRTVLDPVSATEDGTEGPDDGTEGD